MKRWITMLLMVGLTLCRTRADGGGCAMREALRKSMCRHRRRRRLPHRMSCDEYYHQYQHLYRLPNYGYDDDDDDDDVHSLSARS
uniref:Putative secreted protein n=1 Tax=Anopheles marajoara TaxID=58244 RepID=A0A2M4CAW0_9DIPT